MTTLFSGTTLLSPWKVRGDGHSQMRPPRNSPNMARQFSSEDIVRLLLNVERSVVREALTDERLSAHEIWLEKGVILEEIRKITAPQDPRQAFVEIFTAGITAAVGAAEIIRDQATGPVIGGLVRVAMGGVIFILEHFLAALDELARPPLDPQIVDEFDLGVSGGVPAPPPDDTGTLTAAIATLDQLWIHLVEARRLIREHFLEVDPVLQLAEGQISGRLREVDDARARAVSQIRAHL